MSRVDRSGFSLVEVVVALLILSVGIFALGASSVFVLAQVRASQLQTERATAVRDAAERLRAMPWSTLETECPARTFVSRPFTVECSILPAGPNLRVLELVSRGPGYRSAKLVQELADTFVISIAQRPS